MDGKCGLNLAHVGTTDPSVVGSLDIGGVLFIIGTKTIAGVVVRINALELCIARFPVIEGMLERSAGTPVVEIVAVNELLLRERFELTRLDLMDAL